MIGLLATLLVSSPLPREVRLIFHNVKLAIDSLAHSSAATHLSEVAGFYPWRSELLLEAGELALKAGEAEKAIGLFEQAAENSVLPPDSLLALGDAYLETGETAHAVQTWQKLAEDPVYADAVLLRILELHRAEENYALIIEDLTSLVRLHPNEASYYYQLGLVLAVVKPDAALAYLSQAAQNDARLAKKANELSSRINTARLYEEPAYTNLSVGRWMGSVGEWQLAQLAFQQAVEQRPDYAEAWAYLGEALQHNADPSNLEEGRTGLAELQKALELDPDSIPALLLMSIFCQRQDDNDQAMEYLEAAAVLEPENPLLQAELGHVSAKMGDLPEAQDFYERASALAPDNSDYWRLLAEFSLDKQIQVRELALPAARKAVLLAPDDPQNLDLLGKTLISLGDLLNAERFLRRAISADAAYAPAHLHLGWIYLTQGKHALAQVEFATAEQLSPDAGISEQIERLNSYVFP
jgi:tetratricopeptide (TPR) repeat protein